MVGLTDADELLYPLCGVMERLAYDATYDGKAVGSLCSAKPARSSP